MPSSVNLNIGVYLWVDTRYRAALSQLASHKSDEIVLLTTFCAVLVVASVIERVYLSSASGLFSWHRCTPSDRGNRLHT